MRALAPALAALALACGDTLVDHTDTRYFDTGSGPTCAAPNHVCGTACVPEDASSCGGACEVCTTPVANAVPVCAAHACDFECTGGRLREGSACVGVVSVAAGIDHTCAVTDAGTVKCWGSNGSGQLGTGAGAADALVPANVAGITGGATAVSAGWAHTCAVVSGQVLCWGANSTGQLGDPGAGASRATPVAVTLPGGATATSVAAGELHTCALATNGTVYCWGANGFGQLGTGLPGSPVPGPGAAAVLPAASLIAAGRTHTCAILASGGNVYCWGKDADGQVGNDTPLTDAVATPAAVAKSGGGTLAGATDVRGGELHTCAAVLNGANEELWCWGANGLGQVGFDPGFSVHYPAAVQPAVISNARAAHVAAGNGHSCALRSEGGLKCFGSNATGQLGTASPDPGPPLNSNVTFGTATSLPDHIAAGGDHSCARLADGTLYCWGSNAHGELGDGTTTQRFVPTAVSGR